MTLTKKQAELLINIVNASVEMSMKSGIPIGREYYEDIDIIKDKLYQEMAEANRRTKWQMILKQKEVNNIDINN